MEVECMSPYEKSRLKLIAWTKRLYELDQSDDKPSRTKCRNEIEEIAAMLEEAAQILGMQGMAQTYIEEVHGDRYQQEGEAHWTAYEFAKLTIMNLADSARIAAKSTAEMPSKKTRLAVQFAADGYAFIRYHHEFHRPKLSDDGDDVQALKEVCEAAGVHLSQQRIRGALAKALEAFDPLTNNPQLRGLIE